MADTSTTRESRHLSDETELPLDLEKIFSAKVEEWHERYQYNQLKAVTFHFNNDKAKFVNFALAQLRQILKVHSGIQPEDAISKLKTKLDETIGIGTTTIKTDLLVENSKVRPNKSS